MKHISSATMDHLKSVGTLLKLIKISLNFTKKVKWSIIILTHPASQHWEHSFVQIHNGVIRAFVSVDDWVRVQTDDEVVSFSAGFLQEI